MEQILLVGTIRELDERVGFGCFNFQISSMSICFFIKVVVGLSSVFILVALLYLIAYSGQLNQKKDFGVLWFWYSMYTGKTGTQVYTFYSASVVTCEYNYLDKCVGYNGGKRNKNCIRKWLRKLCCGIGLCSISHFDRTCLHKLRQAGWWLYKEVTSTDWNGSIHLTNCGEGHEHRWLWKNVVLIYSVSGLWFNRRENGNLAIIGYQDIIKSVYLNSMEFLLNLFYEDFKLEL